ncbi:iron complex transport system substrate-binding protein [Crossiella equi]|uniref:Iron complex transport system substrate-binding protein n=1 Tax=Crossiella equi TaxID=130796 RepID=A0ABS5AC20_9PSEU|nr:iron-siderophore ABC transporter substrate-binding protein [Crossiella equi]MBP2473245.1 iron complex transport system substrate-binding protein [Crossiella equi]
MTTRTHRSSSRLLRLAAAATALVLGLTACGGGSDAPAQSDPSSGAAPGFPVTITHKLGTTTITSQPKRIVVLGETDLDALLALGIQPIAVVKTGFPDGVSPWAKQKLTGSPTQLTVGDNGFDPEQILKLEPDLVLANYDYYLDKYFAKLNAIVPTTGYETGPSEDSWQQVTRQVGKAVGKSAEAEKLVTDTEAKIAGVRKSTPELTGKPFAFAVSGQTGTMMVLKSKTDTATKLLGEFGLVLPPAIESLPGEGFAAELSAERYDVLDQPVLITYYNDNKQHQADVEGNGLFSKLKAVSKGGNVVLDLAQFYSIRTPSPLGIQYAVDVLVPKLSDAVKKTAA